MIALLAFLFSMIVALGVILGWSLVIGWILTLIFPFELFEGTLLAMLASAFAAYALNHPPGSSDISDWDAFEAALPDDDIPISKFVQTADQKTWENLSRFEIANAIMAEFKTSVNTGQMTGAQLEALAIRMTDAGIALLKRKPPRTTDITITTNQLENQLRRMGFKPDDADILRAATTGINFALYHVPIEMVVKQRMWDQRAPIAVDLDSAASESGEDIDLV